MRTLTVLAVIALWLAPAAAFAQETEDPEITSQAKLHFKAGQDAYAAGKYDTAIKELKRAYVLKRIPAILMNIAMTYRKTKDYEMALYFYRKFLAEAPADDKMRPKVETEVTEVEGERAAASAPQQLEPAKPAFEMAKPAVEAAKPAPAPSPTAEASKPAPDKAATPKPATAQNTPASGSSAATPAPPAEPPAEAAAPVADKPVSEWAHTPIDAVPPGKPVDVRVQMPVMKGVKVKVFYRTEGQASFESIELKRRGNEKIARLPESVTGGRTFQYYLEARDGAGTIVKSSGSDMSPNIVLIDKTARPQLADASGVAESTEEDEPARRTKSGPHRDIENEAVSFDIGGPKQTAMDRLRESLRGQDKKREWKSPLSVIGWVGVGAAAAGLGVLAGGIGSLAVAANDASIVSADAHCENSKNKCLFYGPNDDPTLNKAANPPTSAYEAHGQLYDKIGTALTAAGGVVLAAGGGLLIYDLVRKHNASKPPAVPRKHKVKKVVEVEEVSSLILPYAGPQGAGLVGLINF